MRLILFLLSVINLHLTAALGGENILFSDGLHAPEDFQDWTTDSDFSTQLLAWIPKSDGDRDAFTEGSNFNLAPLPTFEDQNSDYLTSCSSPSGLRAREKDSCPSSLKKEDIPVFPTFGEIENAVSPPGSELGKKPPPVNQIVDFYRAENKCPPTNPHRLCCICDDAFALEVCQDCVYCKQRSVSFSHTSYSGGHNNAGKTFTD